jgi:hypothetical protein
VNWEAIGAVGEVFGGLIVMISVVYLAIQVRQSNRHAEASADVAWMDGWNQVLNGWVEDDVTIETLQAGFEDFDGLPSKQQARFQMKIGAMVNHWVLADQLKSKGLMAEKIFDEATDVVTAVLSTPGGLQYWERDAAATPNGAWLLAHVKENPRGVPMITELFPWWVADDPSDQVPGAGSSS